MNTEKHTWQGIIISIQPRIRLLRSFDERSHNYMGYALRIAGTMDKAPQEFLIGIGKAAQAKNEFRYGDIVTGLSHPVQDPRIEVVEFYKTSGLKLLERSKEQQEPPPWHGIPPDLPTYRQRGHRRLDAHTYKSKCLSCLWGCKMPVEMTIDQWNPRDKRYRFETFCYGPKSCAFYQAGPTRKVPGRKGMEWEEEDWVDEDATAHRGPDD